MAMKEIITMIIIPNLSLDYMAIKEVVDCLRRMTTMEDPISKTSKERAEHSRPAAYVNASYEEMEAAYGIMKKEAKTRLQSDLVDFLCDIWAYANAYKKSGELWRMFGDTKEKQLVEIGVSDRARNNLRINRFTTSDLKKQSKNERESVRKWALWQLEVINRPGTPEGAMFLYFVDGKMERIHGFPFDLTFTHERPKQSFGRRVA